MKPPDLLLLNQLLQMFESVIVCEAKTGFDCVPCEPPHAGSVVAPNVRLAAKVNRASPAKSSRDVVPISECEVVATFRSSLFVCHANSVKRTCSFASSSFRFNKASLANPETF